MMMSVVVGFLYTSKLIRLLPFLIMMSKRFAVLKQTPDVQKP
jgi:hypothetical protein